MHRTIEFPNLGILLENVGDHVTVFGFDIAFYGMIIGIGILAGIFIAADRSKAHRTESGRLLRPGYLCSYLFRYWGENLLCRILVGYVQK